MDARHFDVRNGNIARKMAASAIIIKTEAPARDVYARFKPLVAMVASGTEHNDGIFTAFGMPGRALGDKLQRSDRRFALLAHRWSDLDD